VEEKLHSDVIKENLSSEVEEEEEDMTIANPLNIKFPK